MDNRTPEEQRQEDELEFLRRKALFEPMVASAAWKELEKILLAQHAGQLQNLLAPPQLVANSEAGPIALDGMAQVLKSEYYKGVVFGIQLTLKTPYGTIASANEIIALRQDREKDSSDVFRTKRASHDDDGNPLPESARVTDLSGE